MDRVFKRHRVAELNVVKSQRKFLSEKDATQRFKYLKTLITSLPRTELHKFFVSNRSCIFYTFTDLFFCPEQESKQRANSSYTKDLKSVLTLLENILTLLPDYIRLRWQYNSIVEVLEELLCDRNALSIRKYGIRLFLIWYQVLGTSATPRCHQIFVNLVPKFGTWISDYQNRGSLSTSDKIPSPLLNSSRSYFGISPRECTLFTFPNYEERQSSQDVGRELLEHFLRCLVSDVLSVTWNDCPQDQHLMQFWFLFEQLKHTYLPVIFPCLSPTYSIYEPTKSCSTKNRTDALLALKDYPISATLLPIYQETFVLWLSSYIDTYTSYLTLGSASLADSKAAIRHSGDRSPTLSQTAYMSTEERVLPNLDRLSRNAEILFEDHLTEFGDPRHVRYSLSPVPSRANASMSPEVITISPSFRNDRYGQTNVVGRRQVWPKYLLQSKLQEISMVCTVLYGCRQNINLIMDILHQSFLLPIQCYHALFAAVGVYSSWLENKNSRPVFLHNIEELTSAAADNRDARSSTRFSVDYPDVQSHDGDDESEDSKDSQVSQKPSPRDSSETRSSVNSFSEFKYKSTPVEQTVPSSSDAASPLTQNRGTLVRRSGNDSTEELRGCLQTCIQVMLANMSKVFLLTCPPAVNTVTLDNNGEHSNQTVDYVGQQMELCRRILHIFRLVADRDELNTDSWTILLNILLDVISTTMLDSASSNRTNRSWLSNEKLVQSLFQTMNGCLLRASLFAPIPNDCWNRCTSVYSQLTSWPSLIFEWKKVMQSLTSTMSKLVYGVDLSDVSEASEGRRMKRLAGAPLLGRARPQSFTEAALTHPSIINIPPANLASSVLPASSVDTALDGQAKIGSTISTHSSGPNSITSSELTSVPFESKYRGLLACWDHFDSTKAIDSVDGTFRRRASRRRAKELHFFLSNNQVENSDVPYDVADTLSRGGGFSRSLTGSPKILRKEDSAHFRDPDHALRRAVSDLDEALHSVHDSTLDPIDCAEVPIGISMSDCEAVYEFDHVSVSPDYSALSMGSAADRPPSKNFSGNLALLGLRVEENQDAPVPEVLPSPINSGLVDDSSSAHSRSDLQADSRDSTEENLVEQSKTHHFKSPSSSDIQRSSESSVSHRGGTLTASSHHASSGIDLGHAPSRTQTATNALATAPTKPPRCILAGGMARGWTHESIIVCWRRFLGIMGNLNSIKTVSNLEKVYIYINELVDVLLKIQQNQALSPVSDNCVRPLPLYCTPLDPVLPVLLEALTLPEQPTSIQLSALRALTAALLRPPQGRINLEAIAQFYRLLHRFLSISDKPYVYEIIRSCGMLLFSSELPSCHLLILDFLHGASVIFDDPSPAREAPRIEALTMITTLLCYSTHFGSLDCLDQTDPESIRLMPCSDLRFRLLELLVRVTLNDPSADARCLALSALAIYCVIELVHSESNPASPLPLDGRSASFPIDALAVLLGMMRFSNRSIALVAVDAVRMLTGYFDAFSQLAPGLPLLIVRSLTWTLNYIWDSSYDSDIFQLDKRLLVIIILTITEWMLLLPLSSTRTASYGSGADVESECLLSTVLTTLYKVICTSPPCNSTSSETEQTTTALPVELPDPLVSLLADCQIPIDLKAFSAPQSLLDSSLDVQSYTLTDAKHIWPEYEQLGETSRPQQSIRLAARVALSHMLNHLDHFPMDDQGAQLNTIIQEHHDHFAPRNTFNFDDTSELSLSVLEKDNIQLFAINKSILLSFISLPAISIQQQASHHLYSGSSSLRQPIPLNESAKSGSYPLDIFLSHSPSSSSTSATNLCTAVSDAQYTRVIVRDFSGKYSWDLSVLHALSCNWYHSDNEEFMPDGTSCGKSDNVQDPILLRTLPPCPPPRSNPNPPPLMSNQASLAHSGSPAGDWSHCTPGAVSQIASPNHSSPLALKDSPNTTPDVLQTLLSDLAVSSPECYMDLESNFRDSLPSAVTDSSTIDSSSNMETLTGDQITAQCQMDADILLHNSKYSFSIEPTDREPASIKHPDWYVPPTPPTSPSDDSSQRDSPFDLAHFASCRHLINQLGLLSFECRPTIELIQKSAGLVRDLKHLDKFGVRESHKIAVFYVSAGQEDKQSILANQSASLEFENFVAGLGWEIDLVTHRGFRGGLEQSGRAGKSTPYYATATLEVIFHVSTRMPSSTQEDLKYKHLGNDDVMIIWTENARAFTRGVLRTQFGDVLIIISPLPSGLFRVEVQRKTGVGLFGPIVHLAVLDFKTLPGLVRATAISASRAVRAMKPGYGAHYEERAASLRQIIHRHIAYTCFEDFVQSLILPSVPIDCIPAPSGLNGLNAPRESTDNVRMPPSHFPSQWNPSMPVATTIQQPTVSSQTSVTAGARPGNVTKEKK